MKTSGSRSGRTLVEHGRQAIAGLEFSTELISV
jgi:hypothetical protein